MPGMHRGSPAWTSSARPTRTHRLPPSNSTSCRAGGGQPNYLAVGQIYLLDNPLLREPLTRAHVKPRLLGHFGTTPGLNFIYLHLNRVIKAYGLDILFIAGPGHGAPGVVACTWLEGTYSELYPDISRDEEGMRRLFRQFSFPGGIPSHAAPETRARYTRVANSAIRCRTPMARPSTTRS